MKYFLGIQFNEYKVEVPTYKVYEQWDIGIGTRLVDIIDLISISLVTEEGYNCRFISNEFNLEKAWMDEEVRYDILKPIHEEYCKDKESFATYLRAKGDPDGYLVWEEFNFNSLRYLVRDKGLSLKKIGWEIDNFITSWTNTKDLKTSEIYSYYNSHDWVVFCNLFEDMWNFPKGLSLYCRQLVQDYDKYLKEFDSERMESYPEPEYLQTSLQKAEWNKGLYEFLKKKEV